MRLPFIPPAELSVEQKPLYDDMKAGIAAKYSNFTTMRGDGAILGPWSAWLHDPDLGRALWESTKGMTRFRHLPEMIRQIVILAVGSKFGAGRLPGTRYASSRKFLPFSGMLSIVFEVIWP